MKQETITTTTETAREGVTTIDRSRRVTVQWRRDEFLGLLNLPASARIHAIDLGGTASITIVYTEALSELV